jgi:hypothetical protein
MKTLKVKLTFTEEILGTASSNPDIHREFIASKAADAKSIEEEVAAVGAEEVADKAMTIFPKVDGKPVMWDYQIKGFFKDACGMLARVTDTKSSKLKAYRKVIDGLVFPGPRKILFEVPAGSESGNCQRPLRAQTPQGERICLANSETLPAGTTITFDILIMQDSLEGVVKEWLDYAQFRGLGQWRNSGKGRATWEEVK